ncbi:MAG: TonB family protein [Verrucomicrobia bacterium]|nr:TonB family protein [Verrucomicrobiota bacterium]
MQIELQAASAQPEAPPPAPAPAEVPIEQPLKIPDPEIRAEPVVAKPVEENSQQVSSVAQTAQVAQRASATSAQIESSTPLAGRGRTGEVNWRMLALAKLRAMIEAEKYYPPSAQKAGYEGRFRLQVKIGTDGRILSAAVLDGKGHPMLRHALKKIMTGLQGRDIGQTLPSPLDLSFEFEFKLN